MRFSTRTCRGCRAMLAEQGVEVLAGVVETLDVARAAKARLGVATGNIRAGADAKLAGGRACRTGSSAAATAATRTCAPSSSRRRSQADARVRVAEVIVVGDTIHDIAAARACGATVCAVATGSDPPEALAHADVVFRSMAELPAWHAATSALAREAGRIGDADVGEAGLHGGVHRDHERLVRDRLRVRARARRSRRAASRPEAGTS